MHEHRCENCRHSEEIEIYTHLDKNECPFLICDSGEVVSRWSECDDWEGESHDGTADPMDIRD